MHARVIAALCVAAVACPLNPARGAHARRDGIYRVAPGVYRGPAPETAADYDALERLGIRTVLDLRKYNDQAVACERPKLAARGIRHAHVPMGFFPRRDNTVEQSVRIMADPYLQPVYVHCKLGEDRVGLVIGVYRVRYQGWSLDEAYAEMKQFGFHHVLVGLTRYFWLEAGGRTASRRACLRRRRL